MTSNHYSNPKLRKNFFKSEIVEDNPSGNVNVVHDNADSTWQDNNITSSRLGEMKRMDTLSVNSSNNYYGNAKSKDEFEIYGSFVRQRSEKKISNISSERSQSVLQPSSTFKHLPVKEKKSEVLLSPGNDRILSRSVSEQQNQPIYTSQTAAYPDSPFDLVQSFDTFAESSYSTLPKARISNDVRVSVPQESIVPQRFQQNFSSLAELSTMDDSGAKDQEIVRLNRMVNRMTKKLSVLSDSNQKLQEHIKNLLGERTQLLQQIDNSEFEEIIEEEEVKQARPNVAHVTHVHEQTPQSMEVSHADCVHRSKISLEDVPQIMLESFRIDILNNEKERTDMEKRSLVETLKLQQQMQLQLLQEEFQSKKIAVQHVSVQSYQRGKFYHKYSDTNLRRTPSPRPTSSSVGVNACLTFVSTASQTDSDHARAFLDKFSSSSALSRSQKSLIEKAVAYVENGNYEGLIAIFQNVFCRPSISVGVGNTALYSVKSTSTTRRECLTVDVHVDTLKEIVPPKISQETRGVMARPMSVQRGCQHEDTFSFESGTMTDQRLCRSQGMMTVVDYPDRPSSASSEVDSVVKRTATRLEAQKITFSETSRTISPMKEFVSALERQMESETEHVVDVDVIRKPVMMSEEMEYTVEERIQQMNSMQDKSMMSREGMPIARLKDGEVVDKRETFHNRLVDTDSEEIEGHLQQHDHFHSPEKSPRVTYHNDGVFRTTSHVRVNEETEAHVKGLQSKRDSDITSSMKPKGSLIFSDIKSIKVGDSDAPSKYTEDGNVRVQQRFLGQSVGQRNHEDEHCTEKVEERSISSNLNGTSCHGNEQTFRYEHVKRPVEILSSKETSYSGQETADSNSISIFTSPSSFRPYPTSQGRSHLSSSRTETRRFQSEITSTDSPRIKRGASTESTSARIPINVSSESRRFNMTRMPITNRSSGTLSPSSSNSTFRSLSTSRAANRTVNIPVNVSFIQSDESKLFLSEIIFQNCRQLHLWIKTLDLITSSTVDLLPAPLVTVSSVLLEWWFGVIEKNDPVQLTKIAKYLIYTFSKNFLKYFVITVDTQGSTCLHFVVVHQMWDLLDILDYCQLVDPNVFNGQGYTVLMVACTVKIVTDNGRDHLRALARLANVNLTSRYQGQTALWIAASHGYSLTVQMLYSLGADVNIRDYDDNTPLMVACSINNIDVVTTILSWSGVLVDLRNKEGKSALDIVTEAQFTDLLEIFNQRKTTKASEISSYSRMVQKSYSNKSFGTMKL